MTYLSHIDNLEKTVVTGPGLIILLGGGAASAPVLPSGWCAVCNVQFTVPVERHPLIDLPGVQEVCVLRQDVVALHQGRHLPGVEQYLQTLEFITWGCEWLPEGGGGNGVFPA